MSLLASDLLAKATCGQPTPLYITLVLRLIATELANLPGNGHFAADGTLKDEMFSRIYEPLTVILVEDTEDDLLLALRAFRKCETPIMVKVARDGLEALELLEIEGEPKGASIPNLVLCDMKLPMFGGLEVLAKIRGHAPTSLVPVVMFSSSDEAADVQNAYSLGANSYVQKPVEYHDFMDTVCSIATYWLKTNRQDSTEFCSFQTSEPAMP